MSITFLGDFANGEIEVFFKKPCLKGFLYKMR